MPTRSAIALVVTAFLLTVLIRLPATLLTRFLPHEVACEDPSGTLWAGTCGELRSGELALSGLHWTLHPLSLLGARAVLDLHSDDPRAAGRAQVTLRFNGDAQIQALSALLPLQDGLSVLPKGWNGSIALSIARARIEDRRLAAIEGTVTAQQLSSTRPSLDLGSLQLEFPPAASGAPLGTLRDLGGPLSLQGHVRLTPDGGFELEATVAARDPGNTNLQQLLQMLGPANAQGAHELSLSGSF